MQYMDIFIKNAHLIFPIAFIILVSYIGLFILKRRGAAGNESKWRKPSWGAFTAVAAINIVAHIFLIAVMVFVDAGIEALLLCLLASTCLCLLGGGGV